MARKRSDALLLAAIDFETTGLPLAPRAPVHLQPRAIEFAGVVFTGAGKRLRELSMLINPGREITPEITRITGITNEQLAPEEDFRTQWPRIEEFLAGVRGLVAHNLSFDAFILANELRVNNLHWDWPPLGICTVELFQAEWGRRPRLIELYAHITGKQYQQTHRALDDVEALMEIVTDAKVAPAIAAVAAQNRAYVPPEFRPD